MKETVNVVGLGYIGLPTALMLASHSVNVIGTDCKSEIIDNIKNGNVPFEEEGMATLLEKALNHIQFSMQCVPADIYIIAVPTPFQKRNKKIITDYLVKAVEDIMHVCKNLSIVVIESTVSPGTIDQYVRPIIEKKQLESSIKLHIAHAPERIIPGKMLYELEHNSRTIGTDDEQTAKVIEKLYGNFCKGDIIKTSIKVAEMTKVVENAYRDVNIAFANELVKISEECKIDVYEVIRIANKHPRVNILSPGPGVGGHCISVDPWFLVGDYPGLANIILSARKINDSMPEFVLNKMYEIMKSQSIQDLSRVGLYGLTYKENVDDTRESPTIQLLECMEHHLAAGIKVYDPYVKNDIVPLQYHNLDQFLDEIDFLVIMVGHDELIKNQNKISGKVVFDTRNVLNISEKYTF